MNKLRLYGIWSIIITVMFFILISSAIGAEKEPIKIGVIISITGEAAEMGIENKRTIDVAVDLLNAKGGIKGYPVVAIVVDGQSKPAVFATKAHRLLEAFKVVGGIGGNDISYATAAGEVFQDAKTPFLDIGGTTATIPLVGDYMFMSPIPDNDQGRAVAKYIYEKFGYDTVAIFKDVGSAYGTKLTEYIIHFLKGFTGKENPVPLVLSYNTGDSDYTAQLTRLKASIDKLGIQAIILPTWPQDAPKIAKQARELAINLPLVGTDGVDTSALIEVGGDAVEGMIFSTHFSASQPGLTGFAKEFVEEYIKKEGEEPGAFGTMGYDAFMILAETISLVIEQEGEEWWDNASLADKRIVIRDGLLKIKTTWTTQPINFVSEGWPKRGLVWKVIKDGAQNFYDFQTYESYTPEGIETFPFM
ncbi:hypothetical protein CVT91_04750 [Candidatus Atribacteria bacterium HGW-Atribacteria-1]|nr:MAG: hypothetical protein CVT91_04750 [Candidatus Atribacteria bacterium HGW-Atribacteria-1]